jgi:predicted O-methyltransferase YrrM
LIIERDRLLSELKRINPGHFYSPIPRLEDIEKDASRLFDRSKQTLGGIDLNVEGQLATVAELEQFYAQQPFSEQPAGDLRYYFGNPFFGHSDAIFLYGIMRMTKPKQIIEVGSGFSSFVMLDTNELFFDRQIQLTFIEPYDERLKSRLKNEDLRGTEIIADFVQRVPLSRFEALGAGDILFIDSSHVAKIGSDVNRIILEILPRLAKGVLVHFHDMFFPFEYPREWLEEGRYWNEAYMVRAFLQFNSAFKIRAWTHFLGTFHSERLHRTMPLCMKEIGGGLWLERV